MSYNKKWSTDETCQLITALKMHPVLWNAKHPDSRNKNKKLKSLKTLANLFNVSIVEIERKLRNIHSQYYRERRYYEKYKNIGVEHEFHATWFGYKLLSFMHEQNENEIASEMPVKVEYNIPDLEYDPTRNIFSPAANVSPSYDDVQNQIKDPESTNDLLQGHKRKKTKTDRVDKELFNMLKTTLANQLQPNPMAKNDEFSIFGEFVATKLRNFKSRYAQCTVQHIINNIIYEADLGKYDSPNNELHLPVAKGRCNYSAAAPQIEPIIPKNSPKDGTDSEERDLVDVIVKVSEKAE